jgi:hypothetical protein
MQARLIAYPPERAAITRPLAPDGLLRIGRGEGCGLPIDHPSISRSHAELRAQDGTWILRDLGSKNGCFVEGSRIAEARLERQCWLRLGDVYCEFAPLTAAEVAAAETGLRSRRAAATAHTARLDALQQLDDLLDASLRGVLELSQCDRGFVLLGNDASLSVRASLALDPARLHAREFSGSVGAVRRALDERRSIVANEIGHEPWLASRASVIAGGLSALICLPLLDAQHTLGAIYADRTRPGPAITTLDLELLEAFTERASLWLAARHASELLAANDPMQSEWSDILSAHAGAAS